MCRDCILCQITANTKRRHRAALKSASGIDGGLLIRSASHHREYYRDSRRSVAATRSGAKPSPGQLDAAPRTILSIAPQAYGSAHPKRYLRARTITFICTLPLSYHWHSINTVGFAETNNVSQALYGQPASATVI
jgi:hypothetical protein